MTNIYTVNFLTATTGGFNEGSRVDGVIVTFVRVGFIGGVEDTVVIGN